MIKVHDQLMGFDEAAEAMVDGYAIARKAWGPDVVMTMIDGMGRFPYPNMVNDLFAEDWIVLGRVN